MTPYQDILLCLKYEQKFVQIKLMYLVQNLNKINKFFDYFLNGEIYQQNNMPNQSHTAHLPHHPNVDIRN